ncbi:MAG TPA: protein-disulfide reductase DsbD domain-containing protein [Flavobacteriaceae bacterium]|nr:protein-disulfide reductase DsbD domain-containing protein [Flavobacteriaceae bacterium]
MAKIKYLLSLLFLVFGLATLNAQVPGLEMGESPVQWKGKVEKQSDDSFNLIFQGEIKDGWHVFSQHTPDGGSLPLEIDFLNEGQGYKTNGKAEESPTKKQYNDVFGVDEIIWENQALITQNITLQNEDIRYIKAELFYQVCDEVCINEDYYLVFDLEKEEGQVFSNYDEFESFGEENSPESSGFAETVDYGAGMQMMGDNAESPVNWSGKVEKSADDEYQLVFHADIKENWHIFSQHTPEGGSLPLEIKYLADGQGYQTQGKTEESPTKRQFNDVFGIDEIIWENEATLTQDIKLTDEDTRFIKTELFYQVCDEVCINEEYYLVFDLQEQKAEIFDNYDDFEAFDEGSAQTTDDNILQDSSAASSDPDGPDRSLVTVFILAFLWGFAALLTPCVFPMIPMTVSFFTKQSKTKAAGKRNAILYGIFIILIYVILGTIIVAIFGADSLNKLSTNVTFNIIFALLLIIFAISFLGAFEIVLPASWANKVDKQADRGGIIGIFFMALALAIVSFSCTGPIIGTLLVQAASAGGIAPIVGMTGFSFALAIPFGLFALFPGWMNTMPKSGGWLNSVKVVLGMLELALAFKFLSNADLVVQAYILPREIFLAIWIAIFGMMALYLFGKIQLPNDTKIEKIGVGRFLMGLLTLAFTIYLIPGIWGAPLKMLSGYLPPEHYSESPYGVGGGGGGALGDTQQDIAEGMIPGPQNILAFRDYYKGLEYAKKVEKPMMIDFTGMACVNCRKMEDRVWSHSEIKSIIKNEVVLISLYVDIDQKLPEDEQYTSETTGKRIRTVGNRWSDFQIERFQMHAQPYYVLMDPETEEILNEPAGYVPDKDEYRAWLREGIDRYQKPTADFTEVRGNN